MYRYAKTRWYKYFTSNVHSIIVAKMWEIGWWVYISEYEKYTKDCILLLNILLISYV